MCIWSSILSFSLLTFGFYSIDQIHCVTVFLFKLVDVDVIFLKMDSNAYHGDFHSTGVYVEDYLPDQAFSFLIVIVSFAESFSHSIRICDDGVWLDWHEQNMMDLNGVKSTKVRIYFYKDKIYYFFNKAMHCYTHTPIVQYIYHLMSLMDHVSWMKVVLKKVYMNTVKSLQHMYIMKCLQQCFESTLRRYLTHAERIIQAFSTHDMLPLTSQGHVQYFLQVVNDRNIYEKIGLHIAEHFRQSIYMHQFYFYGIYSDWYNRYTLTYLLVMESTLETRYKWQKIDHHTHYCYHIYSWRYKWENNIWLSIFMDSKKELFCKWSFLYDWLYGQIWIYCI